MSSENKINENEKAPDISISRVRRLYKRPLYIAVIGLFLIAVFYTLYFARALFIPIFFAIILSLLLAPAVEAMTRFQVPRAVGSAVVLIVLVALVAAAFSVFYQPAAGWIEGAPSSLNRIERKLRFIKEPVKKIGEATKSVEEITEVAPAPRGSTVAVGKPGMLNMLIYETSELIFGIATMLILLYFLLASGDLFLRKVINALPKLKDKKQAVGIARRVEQDISVYLYTIVTINICLGVLVGAALYLLGMPNPFLWGAMAGLVNFIPYLGPMVGITVVAIVALLTFDNVYQALLPPLAYLVIDGLEGNFVTPMILGRRLLLNPVVIFLALIFWGWIWGVAGALIAVPIVVILKIICDHSESLKPVGEFLGK